MICITPFLTTECFNCTEPDKYSKFLILSSYYIKLVLHIITTYVNKNHMHICTCLNYIISYYTFCKIVATKREPINGTKVQLVSNSIYSVFEPVNMFVFLHS